MSTPRKKPFVSNKFTPLRGRKSYIDQEKRDLLSSSPPPPLSSPARTNTRDDLLDQLRGGPSGLHGMVKVPQSGADRLQDVSMVMEDYHEGAGATLIRLMLEKCQYVVGSSLKNDSCKGISFCGDITHGLVSMCLLPETEVNLVTQCQTVYVSSDYVEIVFILRAPIMIGGNVSARLLIRGKEVEQCVELERYLDSIQNQVDFHVETRCSSERLRQVLGLSLLKEFSSLRKRSTAAGSAVTIKAPAPQLSSPASVDNFYGTTSTYLESPSQLSKLRKRRHSVIDDDVLEIPPGTTYKMDPPLAYTCGKDTFTIYQSDFKSLYDGCWVNDTLIEFFIAHWYEQSAIKDQCHVFSSFFYPKLVQSPDHYQNVKKWVSKVDLKKRYIVLPVNESLHWFGCIIYNLDRVIDEAGDENSKQKVRIIILDSLFQKQEPVLEPIKDFIMSFCADRFGIQLERSQIKFKNGIVPRQPNFNDCGVHLICNMKLFFEEPEQMIQILLAGKRNTGFFKGRKTARNELREMLIEMHKNQKPIETKGENESQDDDVLLIWEENGPESEKEPIPQEKTDTLLKDISPIINAADVVISKYFSTNAVTKSQYDEPLQTQTPVPESDDNSEANVAAMADITFPEIGTQEKPKLTVLTDADKLTESTPSRVSTPIRIRPFSRILRSSPMRQAVSSTDEVRECVDKDDTLFDESVTMSNVSEGNTCPVSTGTSGHPVSVTQSDIVPSTHNNDSGTEAMLKPVEQLSISDTEVLAIKPEAEEVATESADQNADEQNEHSFEVVNTESDCSVHQTEQESPVLKSPTPVNTELTTDAQVDAPVQYHVIEDEELPAPVATPVLRRSTRRQRNLQEFLTAVPRGSTDITPASSPIRVDSTEEPVLEVTSVTEGKNTRASTALSSITKVLSNASKSLSRVSKSSSTKPAKTSSLHRRKR